MKKLCLSLAVLVLAGCTGIPEGVTPVQHFEPTRYLGTWYEIARLDHSFERGLTRVRAEYSLQEGGAILVVNRGFLPEKNKWKQAEGRALFVQAKDEGHLKVSFFGPFYSSYIIFELDRENYQYAYVSGASTAYLWFLSRTPTVSQEELARFVTRADQLGFDTNRLIFVDQK